MEPAPAISTETFPALSFHGTLRPSQQEVVELAAKKLAAGARRLHIVAPPGSGKTVLGLYLWTQVVRKPAVVLSPNSAIQSQWVQRCELFAAAASDRTLVSTEPADKALLTSITYQSVTMPGRGDEELSDRARGVWIDRLVASAKADDPTTAQVWIDDLRRHNPAYYEQRLAVYRKEIRDDENREGKSLKWLHASAEDAMALLREGKVGLVILDECHHLLGHWGRVLAASRELLEQPVVIGLTATPPDRAGKRSEDVKRYDELLGPIDYEVPVPAVVKDGFLAPYQDLAYFVRPSPAELQFVANADAEFKRLVDDLCRPRLQTGESEISATRPATAPETSLQTPRTLSQESMTDWVARILTEQCGSSPAESEQGSRTQAGWHSFIRNDPEFSISGRRLLVDRGVPLPAGVPEPGAEPEAENETVESADYLVPVIERYVRKRLRPSHDSADHEMAERAVRRLRMLGMQLTERGCQPCASPVTRVLAYSSQKTAAVIEILRSERAVLGDRLRAVVVTDFEKSSAISADVEELLAADAGGAVAAFRALLTDPDTDALNPVLVTGSSVLVDDDLREEFAAAAELWLTEGQFDVQLSFDAEEGFHVLNGRGADWCPRVYVALVTELFQRGLTKCLIGTRGLLGEGWDADKINVLIDLSTVTTSMTTNQLRGRSIRLDPTDPEKVADNWDVVCIAPEFTKGLDDYARFRKKHEQIFGVADDGAIEKGVGHVHAALTELKPEGLEGSAATLNAGMMARAGKRTLVRDLWKIGEPYRGIPIQTAEVNPATGNAAGFPPFRGQKTPWDSRGLTLAVAHAVLGALKEAGLVKKSGRAVATDRAGGYVRAFLEGADSQDALLFSESLAEAFGPFQASRYMIPRRVDFWRETWLSRRLPEAIGRFLRWPSRETVMWHSVPAALAKNKDLVAVYQRHWNAYVSPGEAIFSQRGPGRDRLESAQARGKTPSRAAHRKEIFV